MKKLALGIAIGIGLTFLLLSIGQPVIAQRSGFQVQCDGRNKVYTLVNPSGGGGAAIFVVPGSC